MRIPLFLTAIIVLLASCASFSSENPQEDQALLVENSSLNLTSTQAKLIEAADWMEGRRSLKINGRTFGLDCTGIVLAAYWYAGIDLAKDFGSYTGNGVRRLYYYLDDKALLYNTDLPHPGDIIFWDNTWDANGNEVADDSHTHVGMIVSMDRSTGAGTYLHYNYSKGIVKEKINLLDPDNPAVNSPLRMRSLPKVDGYRYLSSQLVNELGRGYELGS
ncbi:MAG: CHAP domain-containing protein [Spirochaetales bacterium]|nr:CHAP domain-containing protein [Spirochaetales bacterium]